MQNLKILENCFKQIKEQNNRTDYEKFLCDMSLAEIGMFFDLKSGALTKKSNEDCYNFLINRGMTKKSVVFDKNFIILNLLVTPIVDYFTNYGMMEKYAIYFINNFHKYIDLKGNQNGKIKHKTPTDKRRYHEFMKIPAVRQTLESFFIRTTIDLSRTEPLEKKNMLPKNKASEITKLLQKESSYNCFMNIGNHNFPKFFQKGIFNIIKEID